MPSVLSARANPETKDLVHQHHRYTACVVVGKTTVCRIFSCQRSDGDYVPKPFADPVIAGLAEAHGRFSGRERRLVENTGLEPATSWLQTRRSPS